jgi:hypothetical protein
VEQGYGALLRTLDLMLRTERRTEAGKAGEDGGWPGLHLGKFPLAPTDRGWVELGAALDLSQKGGWWGLHLPRMAGGMVGKTWQAVLRTW